MPDSRSPTTRLICRIADRQHGVVSRTQLLNAGIRGRAIDGRIDNGWLLPASRGIYAVGRAVSDEPGIWIAAVLAGGSNTVLAGRSAACHWGFMRWHGQIDLLRARSRTPRIVHLGRPGLAGPRTAEVRRTGHLVDSDLNHHRGIRTTSVARTLLDLAAIVREERLRAAFNEADRMGLLREDALTACAAKGRGWTGISRFRSLVERRHPLVTLTRSELEVAFLELCRQHGIPQPLVNAKVIGLEVDCLWPDQGLIIELDGYEFHSGRMASIKDGARDNRLRTAGFRVVRFTYDAVVNHPMEVMRVIEMELSRSFSARSSPK
ncbi:MAG: DUF559 domain-containing protein [Actinomycetota bacterium]|nr:DUF559 domain-containing protein [Actinomycetota bacterium]